MEIYKDLKEEKYIVSFSPHLELRWMFTEKKGEPVAKSVANGIINPNGILVNKEELPKNINLMVDKVLSYLTKEPPKPGFFQRCLNKLFGVSDFEESEKTLRAMYLRGKEGESSQELMELEKGVPVHIKYSSEEVDIDLTYNCYQLPMSVRVLRKNSSNMKIKAKRDVTLPMMIGDYTIEANAEMKISEMGEMVMLDIDNVAGAIFVMKTEFWEAFDAGDLVEV